MKQFKAKIISNKKIAEDHYLLLFKAPKIAKIVKPGQFFNVRVKSSYEPLLRRPLGTHKIHKDGIEFLYKVVGKATEILSAKKKGESLDILGPLGNGFNLEPTAPACAKASAGRHNPQPIALLVGGGHGVSPLVALAGQLKAYSFRLRQGFGGQVQLIAFIGAKTKKYVVCDKDFRKLGIKAYVATEDGSKGHKGLVTDLLERKAHSPHPTAPACAKASAGRQIAIYACGPNPMLKAVAKLAERYKIPCQVSLEEYMACGIGTCLGCAVKTKSGYKLVCKDGPVFDAKEIVWQT